MKNPNSQVHDVKKDLKKFESVNRRELQICHIEKLQIGHSACAANDTVKKIFFLEQQCLMASIYIIT